MSRAPGEPRLSSLASWAVLAASFGLSASTWIALARLAGFSGEVRVGGLVILALAWLMPLVVDGYVVVALVLWMSPVPPRVARFARMNTYVAAAVGVLAQAAYHSLLILDTTSSVWRTILAAVVGALPPAGAALSVHMRALIRRESRSTSPDTAADMPADVQQPNPQVTATIRADMNTDATEAAEASRARPPAAPKRSFAVTQRAAAAMQTDGMEVPAIAEALGLSERQVRRALKPVPVTSEEQS